MPTAYVTAPPEAADELATALVEERLAACVNRVDCRSTYRWTDADGGDATGEDAILRDDEVILLAKTTSERYDALEARIAELHPYDVPCIERFDESGMLPAYADWVADATESQSVEDRGESSEQSGPD
ncbi:divalent-cation tolerance protein CutA [Halorubellus sp. JP-L1]|uniref:divalent-cation tolerance protein CutA n=1 Tax=Halorubellus sp. JP-L1 TaxID=2715753 RepID=UPI00140AF4E4|nr:divalent-cation tolerance protein CutA [Halorubellus sp. JP-L1]NHN40869.1 divalent-cation tolerance protein CutA [Halorubellus sp. JP-L1]